MFTRLFDEKIVGGLNMLLLGVIALTGLQGDANAGIAVAGLAAYFLSKEIDNMQKV